MQKKYLILIKIFFILIIFFLFFNYIIINLNTFYYNILIILNLFNIIDFIGSTENFINIIITNIYNLNLSNLFNYLFLTKLDYILYTIKDIFFKIFFNLNIIDLLLSLLPQEQIFSYFYFIFNKLIIIIKFLSLKSLSSSYLIFINDNLINLITNNNINIFICYIFIKILLKIKIIIIILTKIFITNFNKILLNFFNKIIIHSFTSIVPLIKLKFINSNNKVIFLIYNYILNYDVFKNINFIFTSIFNIVVIFVSFNYYFNCLYYFTINIFVNYLYKLTNLFFYFLSVLTQLSLIFKEYIFTFFSSSYFFAFWSQFFPKGWGSWNKEFLLNILVEIKELVSLNFVSYNQFIIFKVLIIILLNLFIIIFIFNYIKNFKDKLVYLHIYPKYILYTCSFFTFSNDDSEGETEVEEEGIMAEEEGITAEAEINNNLVNEVFTAEEADLTTEENLEAENYKDIDENIGWNNLNKNFKDLSPENQILYVTNKFSLFGLNKNDNYFLINHLIASILNTTSGFKLDVDKFLINNINILINDHRKLKLNKNSFVRYKPFLINNKLESKFNPLIPYKSDDQFQYELQDLLESMEEAKNTSEDKLNSNNISNNNLLENNND